MWTLSCSNIRTSKCWRSREIRSAIGGKIHLICDYLNHDDVINWKHFPRYWPSVRGIHQSPVNSPRKGQCRGAFMFSLIWAWTNGWVNNPIDAGDLKHRRAHYDVTVMIWNHWWNDRQTDIRRCQHWDCWWTGAARCYGINRYWSTKLSFCLCTWTALPEMSLFHCHHEHVMVPYLGLSLSAIYSFQSSVIQWRPGWFGEWWIMLAFSNTAILWQCLFGNYQCEVKLPRSRHHFEGCHFSIKLLISEETVIRM